MHPPDASQHAPHGVSVHDPPDDHAPPPRLHALCVVKVHAPALQQVPHGCVMHDVPAPAQNPPHAACVVTVQFPALQQVPVGAGAGHGLGEHVVFDSHCMFGPLH